MDIKRKKRYSSLYENREREREDKKEWPVYRKIEYDSVSACANMCRAHLCIEM